MTRIRLDGEIVIHDLAPKPLERLRRRLSVPNPAFQKAKRMGFATAGEPETIESLIEMPDGSVHVPRGAIGVVREVFLRDGVPWGVDEDERAVGEALPSSQSTIVLRDYQEEGVAKIVRHLQGLIVLACGTGKTMLGVAAVHRIGRTALVIVPTEDLVDQWCETLVTRLGLLPGRVGGGLKEFDRDVVVGIPNTLLPLLEEGAWCGLGERFGFVIVDEAHRVPTKRMTAILRLLPARWRLGLSIGPDSRCEFVGGPFGVGWVGTIAEAYEVAAKNFGTTQQGEYDTVSSIGVLSRGWSGTGFSWKPVKQFIRHACTKKTTRLSFRGHVLVATNDHSVFEVTEHGLVERRTDALDKGSILAYDDGADWTTTEETEISAISLVPDSHVAVSLDSVTASDLSATPREWYAWRRRAHGHALATSRYLRFAHILPTPTRVYTEGAHGNWCLPVFLASDLAYALGLFIGNGWVDETCIGLSIRNDRVVAVRGDIANLTAMRVSTSAQPPSGGATQIKCGNSFFVALVRFLFPDQVAHTKRIPATALISWPESARRNLMRGLMDTDGHEQHRDRDRQRGAYTTTSPRLAQDVVVLLRSMGVTASIRSIPPGAGGVIDGRRIIGLHDRFDVHWSLHAMNGDNGGQRGLRSRHHVQGISEISVDFSEPCATPEFVFDLAMDGHPSFVANGILVHNTATPDREDGLGALVDWSFGPTLVTRSTQDMIRLGYLEKASIDVVETGWTFAYTGPEKKRVAAMERALTDDLARNAFVADRVAKDAKAGESVLVLANRKTMVKELAEMLALRGVGVRGVTGDTSNKKRKDAIADLRGGGLSVMVATSLADEGLDVSRLSRVHLAYPQKARGATLQRLGRILRLFPGKKPRLIDYVDGDVPTLKRRAAERARVYRACGLVP